MLPAVIRTTIETRALTVLQLLLSDPAAASTQLHYVDALYRSNAALTLLFRLHY